MQFLNPIGDVVIINQQAKTDAEYEIYMIWNFPQGLGVKVKIGRFYSYFLHDQKLYLYENMIQWASGYSQVSLAQLNVLQVDTNHCNIVVYIFSHSNYKLLF